MTLAELRTFVGQLLQTDLDNYVGDAPTAAELTAQINRAMRVISKHVRPYWPNVGLTIAVNDQSLALDSSKFARAMLTIERIYRSSTTEVQVVPYDVLNAGDNWRYASAGTPELAAIHGNTIIFNRPWDAITNLKVEGEGHYPSLTNVTDDANSPEIPVNCHEAIAYIAAIIAAEPSVTEGVAINRLKIYNERAWSEIDYLRQEVAQAKYDLRDVGGSGCLLPGWQNCAW